MLEFVEASLDAVSCLVDLEVVGDELFSGRIAGDDRGGPERFDEFADGIAVIGLVGKDVASAKAVEKSRCLWGVPGLAWGQEDPQRPAQAVGQKVDLGGQSSSGTPQSLILVPPFPVAAC